MFDAESTSLQSQDVLLKIMQFVSRTEHHSGLLALGAVAVAACAAYLGLDRIRVEPDNLQDELQKRRERVNELLLRMDVKEESKMRLKEIFNVYQVHILCHVANFKIQLGPLHRLRHAVQRQLYVPLLSYFRHRMDRFVVGAMGLVSTIVFLLVTAATLWNLQWVDERLTLRIFFWLLSGIILWLFFTAAVSYRLRKIGKICDRFETYVKDRLEAFKDDAIRALNGSLAGDLSKPGS